MCLTLALAGSSHIYHEAIRGVCSDTNPTLTGRIPFLNRW